MRVSMCKLTKKDNEPNIIPIAQNPNIKGIHGITHKYNPPRVGKTYLCVGREENIFAPSVTKIISCLMTTYGQGT